MERTRTHEDELFTLWPEAQRMARCACARTLWRLRQGEGGFYDADDLWQDLFLEFWGLARRWSLRGPRDPQALWAAWRRALARGGWRVVRRAPQRLWDARERPIAPEQLCLEADPSDDASAESGLPAPAQRALRQEEDSAEAQGCLAQLEALECALWTLPAGQRQALYLTAIEGLSADEAARCLGLASANAARQRVCAARAALRRKPHP